MQGNVVDNRYDVVQPLGSGGMGEVYLARDRILGRDVALKVLRSQYARDEESADRFKREARSAARVSHPNIVQVYDRGDTEDHSSYIAMEYVPGGTLKDRIKRDGPLPSELAASFGYQVAEALGAAHNKGLVHRDVKPQNVLITENGEAKVTDFGIARAVSAATSSQTQTGTILGTAGYMSPEQSLGKPATPKSDLYSLGVVLYEALTGELPFTADNPVAVSMKHVNEAPRPPQEVNPAVPDGVNAIVMKLLSKDPDDRYPGAEELAEDLLRVRRGGAPAAAAAPGETSSTVEEPPQRQPQRPAQTTRQAAAPRRRKRRGAPLILLALFFLLLGLIGTAWALTQDLSGGSGVEEAVPSVEGQPRDEAVAELENAGFTAEVQTQQGPASEAGQVIDQSPPGGDNARQGSTVTLTVGNGPRAGVVPEVVGLNVADAEARIEGAGLAVGFERRVASESAEGLVVAQGIPAGNEVGSGTEVALDISSGPVQPTTPTSSASASASQESGADSSAAPEEASASAPASAPANEEAGKEAEKAAKEARKAAEEAREEAAERVEERAKAAEEATEERGEGD